MTEPLLFHFLYFILEVILIGYRMLCFDSATKHTGYSMYESGRLEKYGLIDFERIKNTDERMKKMVERIYKTIDTVHPQIIITEMTVVPRNTQAQRNLTMILGAIYGYCVEFNILYHSYRPTEWRKLVHSSDEKLPRKREELKEWSRKKVEELFGIANINDDISDAILLGTAYINQFENGEYV